MKKNLKKMFRLAIMLTMLTLVCNAWTQTLPFVIANKSEFSDDEVYVGLVGRIGDVGVWFDCATQTVKTMQVTDNTVPGPTLGGNPGPGGNSMYANCFTRLSNIPNKTLNLPQISSVRIFIAFESQLYLYFFGNNGGYSAPDLNNPTDPNQGIRYELIELTYNSIGLWANTTRVDNYQYPMGLEVWGSNIPYQKVGEILTHEQILNAWVTTVPASFQGCYNADLGIIHAPSKTPEFKEGGSMYNYFDSYVNQIWNRYQNEDLTIGIGDAGSWKGRVQADGQRFIFTRISDGRVGIVEARPNTQEILEGKGVLAHDVPETPTADDLDVQKHFCAAFNRGAINPNAPAGVAQYWGNEADFFVNNKYNEFVKFWHREDISYNGQTYAFCYDDVFDYSSTIMATSPTRAIITIGGFAGAVAPVLTTISVTPTTATVSLNSTQQYTATGYDQNGAVMAITPTWTCSAGTINANGLYTGSVAGTNTITATVGSVRGTATAQVVSGPANIALGKPVTVTSTENAGTPGSAAVDGNVGTRWSSAYSDPQSITIDLQATYTVNRVVLNWEAAAGKSFQIQISPDGNAWTNIYSTTTGAGGNQSYTVSGTGRYIRMYGTVRTTGYGYSLWEFEVYGTPGNTIPVTGVTLNATTASINVNATTQLTATIVPSNATNKNVTWSSSNTAVATVNSAGLVTGVTAGSATITVTTVDGNFKANCTVTVNSSAIPVTGVTLNTATASINTGATTQLAATVAPVNATNKNVSWSSSNTAVATVSPAGLVTGVAAGTSIITVTTQDGGKTASCTVTVSVPVGTNLALNKPVTVSSIENAGTPGTAGVDGNAGTRWSSLPVDPQTFMIDLGASYNITRVVLNWETASAKAYQIQVSADGINNWTTIYSTTNGIGGVEVLNVTGTGRYIRAYCTVRNTAWGYSLWEFEVYGTPFTGIPVTGVTVSPATASLALNATTQLTATVAPANATNKNVTWSSSNTTVATVSSTGLVTAKVSGTATITVTTQDGGKIATSTITVVATPSNIALGKPATASTVEGTLTANMANDGNNGTRWGSAFADPQWLTIDLQSTYTISQVILRWEAASAKSFQIQVSTDNANWTNIYSTTSGPGGTQTLNVSGQGRYIRMYGTTRNTAYGYSLWEMEVFGTLLKSAGDESFASTEPEDVIFFPNPVATELNVQLNEAGKFNTISLFDFSGKLVLIENIEIDKENVVLNVEMLKSGIYIMKLSGTTESKIFKVVKN